MARQKEFHPTQVIEKAMHAFWEQGYEGTSIEDLARHTGLGRGSLYNTFKDKHALYLAALDLYEQTGRERRKILHQQEGPFLDVLQQFFHVSIDDALKYPTHRGCLMVNASLEQAPYDPQVAQRVQAAFGEIEEAFYHVLIKAQASGMLAWTHDPHQLARFLLNAHLGIRVLARTHADRRMLQEIVTTTLSVFQ